MSKELPTVFAENFMTIAPDLTIKVVVLSNGQRIIPEEDMRRACEWLGIHLSSLEAGLLFPGAGQ